ncbi:hypothetical protein COL401_07100 [Helicobacter pylori]
MAIKFGVIFIDNNNIDSFFNDRRKRSVTHLTDDPSATFNLKNYLLVLAKKFYCSVYYCENINTQKIELISNEPDNFKGVLLEFSQITSLSPNKLPQFLANFKFSKSSNGIDKAEFSLSSLSLENMTPIDNLLSTLKCRIKNTLKRYSWHGYSKIPQEKRITQIKKQVSEECKVEPFFHSLRVSSEQNRKVNKIAEDLKNGKIVGEKIIDNVFDINASLGNYLLKESSQLIIEVPREALDLENVDRLVENTLSHRVYSESSLVYHLNKGSYIIDLHLIDD